MNCAEAGELLGAHALDALPAAEAEAMRAHIASCADHAAQYAELRATALMLPALAEPMDAPASLRARVLSAVAAETAAPSDAPVAIASRRAEASSPRAGEAQSRVSWSPRALFSGGSPAWGALAAVLVAAIVGLTVWNLSLRGDDDSLAGLPEGATAVARLEGTPGVTGSVIYFGGEGRALLVADGVPELDGQTYQAWAIRGGEIVSLGTMDPAADGHMSGIVQVGDAEGATIAITIEPAGGSEQPSGDPVVSAKL